MFETLESRRMMSVSTTTDQEPVVTTTPTTTTIDSNPLAAASQVLSAFSNSFGDVLKSLGDSVYTMARKA